MNTPVIMNEYASLAQYGNLYLRPDNGVNRIRVGVWSVQADAELAQSLIMAEGYKDAVVVVEKSDTGLPTAVKPTTPAVVTTPTVETPPTMVPELIQNKNVNVQPTAAPPVNTGAPSFTPVANQGALPDLLSPVAHSTTNPAAAKMVPVDEPGAVYMVRICSITGDPSQFDVKKAEKAGGKLDARQSATGAVVMLLTNLADYQAAVIARERLIANGFKDAFVVKEINNDGILRRIPNN